MKVVGNSSYANKASEQAGKGYCLEVYCSIFSKLMDSDKVATRLIIGERVKNVEEAGTLLGRIVFDRCAAQHIFVGNDAKANNSSFVIYLRPSI